MDRRPRMEACKLLPAALIVLAQPDDLKRACALQTQGVKPYAGKDIEHP